MSDERDDSCTRTRELLARAREQEITEAEIAERDAHLAGCAGCREAASWLDLADQLARTATAPEELSGERLERVVEAVMERVAAEPVPPSPRRSWWRFAPAFTGLAALAVLLFFFARSPERNELLPVASPRPAELQNEDRAPARMRQDAEREQDALEEVDGDGALGKSELRDEVVRSSEVGVESSGEAAAEPQAAPAAPALEEKTARRGLQTRLQSAAAPSRPSWNGAFGSFPPASAAEAESLRNRWREQLRVEEDPALRDSLATALEELERLWPQDPDSN